jgi:hypothetical protein
MGNKEEYQMIAELIMRCADDDWTFQFNRAENGKVKITAFADEDTGLSFFVDAMEMTVPQIAYMTRKLIQEVENAEKEKITGENRTLPA